MSNNIHHLQSSNQQQTEPPLGYGAEGSSGGSTEERLTRLETRMEYLATKEDITNAKNWILCGIIGVIVSVAGLAITIVKVF